MVYRPPVKKSTFDGTKGAAKIALSKDKTKAKVQFVNADGTEGKTLVVDLKECPDDVKAYIHSGDFFVNMDADGEKIYSLYPLNGMFEVRVAEFSHQKDQPPKPMTKIGGDGKGKTWEYLYFVVLNEIVSGECKGMHVPLFLRYNFSEEVQDVNGAEKKVTGYSKSLDKSKHTAMLDDFLTITGAWNYGPIPYSDNVLPAIEKRIKKAGVQFSIIMKKGYIDTFYQQTDAPKKPAAEEFDANVDDFDAGDLQDDPTEDNTEDKFE